MIAERTPAFNRRTSRPLRGSVPEAPRQEALLKLYLQIREILKAIRDKPLRESETVNYEALMPLCSFPLELIAFHPEFIFTEIGLNRIERIFPNESSAF